MKWIETNYNSGLDTFRMQEGLWYMNIIPNDIHMMNEHRFQELYNAIPQEEYVKALLCNHKVALLIRQRKSEL